MRPFLEPQRQLRQPFSLVIVSTASHRLTIISPVLNVLLAEAMYLVMLWSHRLPIRDLFDMWR
jgi:hypothetical protein